MGFMGTVGHFILILAYQRAPASTLTPYLYAQIAFAMLGGWRRCSPMCRTAISLIGMGLIAVCGAAGAWLTVRERRVGHRSPAMTPRRQAEESPWPSSSKSTPTTPSSAC